MVIRASPETYFQTAERVTSLSEPVYYPPSSTVIQQAPPTVDKYGFWVVAILGAIGLIGILAIAATRK